MKQKHKNKMLLIDDEYLALSYLKDTIEDVIYDIPVLKSFEILGTTNYNDFQKLLMEETPYIIFLDIQMPKKNGLEIAKDIRENYKKYGYNNIDIPIIIFVTAYENYGYQAFKVNAYDYILKPIDEEKIKDVFLSLISHNDFSDKSLSPDSIKIHSNGIDLDIPINDIIYFKAEQKHVVVSTEKKDFFINETLLSLEEKFKDFIRTHRTYLVNPSFIKEVFQTENGLFIKLKNHSEIIPISRRQKIEFENKIDYKKLFY